MRQGDIRRFVIPWRCRVFHIAPHPWDHISSPHPQSPNRFIYRPSSCTHSPPLQHMHIYYYRHIYSCIYAINSRHVEALITPYLKYTNTQFFIYVISMIIFNSYAILPLCLGPRSLHDGAVIALIYSTKQGLLLSLE